MWHTPVISAIGRLRQEDQEFKFILGHTVSLSPAWAHEAMSQANYQWWEEVWRTRVLSWP